MQQKSTKITFISSREFIICSVIFKLSNGQIILSSHSIDYEDVDPSPNTVRAHVNSIFVFTKLSKSLTQITNILNVDLKGGIMRFVSNKSADMQFDDFVTIRRKILKTD